MSSASSSWFRLFAVLFAVTASATLHATTLVIDAGQLELPGGWETITTPHNEFARKYLLAGPHAKGAPAAGAVDLPHAGQWRLWVRSKDFAADRPGIRNFTVRLGDVRSPTVFGRHGHAENDGWAWEDGGTLDLPAGPTLVAIGDESTSSARCDTLVLSDNPSYRPEGVPWKLSKSAATFAPLTIDAKSKLAYQPAPFTSVKDTPRATLQNEHVRFSFHEAIAASGPAIALRAATRDGDRWIPIEGTDAEGYRVLFRPKESDPKIVSTRVRPAWDTAFSPVVEATCGDARVSSRMGPATAPWASAKCFALHPSGAHQRDAQTVDLDFPETPEGRLKATWHLSAQQPAAQVELHFQPKEPGHYSLGYHAPLSCAPGEADFLLLPFMYQGKRFPEEPSVVLSALTPTPLALVNRAGVSCALVGDPRDLPFEWPTHQNSHYAFALRNESGAAQPLIYLPVLGQPGSASDGGAIRARFHVWLQRGDWYTAYHRIAEEIIALEDYRRPVTASLSDAALNIVDLMRNEEAAGWNARAKGPWNIESRNTVSQVSPLTYLSIYLLTGDEDFYQRFARPSLEYLLSRPGPHFAAEHEIWDNYYHHQPMRGPGALFGASTFASAYAMTQGHSAVFGALCLDEKGAPRMMHANGHTQPFADALALYRLTGERRWLDVATDAADKYTAVTLDNRNIDRVLAEGGGKFHCILLNQVHEPQRVGVTFDEKVLGRTVDGATLHVCLDNQDAPPVTIKGNTAEITLSALGIAALTLDGVKIDVPTHRVMPPDRFTLPSEPAIQRAPFAGTALEAVGTEIQVSPFTWRDLYVYVTAAIDDVRSATLRYRVGDGPEQQIVGKEFPWEFTARIENLRAPISWQVNIETSDGRKLIAKP